MVIWRITALALVLVPLTPSCANQPPNPTFARQKLGDLLITAVKTQGRFSWRGTRSARWQVLLYHEGDTSLTVRGAGEERSVPPGVPVIWVAPRPSRGVNLSADGPLWIGEPRALPSGSSQLLFSVDTLRADVLTPEHAPQLLSAFSEGWVLDDLYSSAPWTLPAHASLLFSRFPAEHGARLPDQRVSADPPSLAQEMARLGYITLAVVEGNYVSARHGLDLGFDCFLERPPNIASHDPREASVLEANLTWLRTLVQSQGSAKVFLFWHTYEIHCPYLPRGAGSDPMGLGRTNSLLALESAKAGPLGASPAALSEENCRQLRQLYLGELTYLDSQAGPFLAQLPKDWLVALVSDHGEEFCEHGGLLHADTLYEEVMRVPLLLRGPGLPPQPGPSRSLLDIAPTLLALQGEPAPASWQGHSLTGQESTPLLMESFFLGPHIPAEDPSLLGFRRNSDKLIQLRNFGRYQAELYDLAADPGERNNLASERVALRDRLFQILEAYAQRHKVGESSAPLTPEERQLLESLGYLLPGSQP